MTPILLIGLGLALLVAGGLVLRATSPRLRVGRLLAVTPKVTIQGAVALARAGGRRYVRVDGRLDADEPFEDPDHRPLVLRRTRIEARDGRGWRTIEDERQDVPFEIREGLDSIGVDGQALDEGLVVVPRESRGLAADLGPRLPTGMSGTTEIRARVEQVSSVEHAIALGVPVADQGAVRLTAGLGRPLVLSTVEPSEAMRILAEGRTRGPRAAALLLAGGGLAVVAGIVLAVAEALT